MAGGSFWQQLMALMWRNFKLKSRRKKQTIQEFVVPVLFIALLGIGRIITSPKPQAPVNSFASLSLSKGPFQPFITLSNSHLLVSPNTTDVSDFIDEVLSILGLVPAMTITFFNSQEDSEKYYRNVASNSSFFGTFIGIDFADGTLAETNYTVRMPYTLIASTANTYGNQGQCRNASGMSYCPANTYLYTGFAVLQNAINTAFIRRVGGQGDFPQPDLSVQQYPMGSYSPITLGMQQYAPIYFVLAYSPFVNFLTVSLVSEKEYKIKESMRLMGMRDSAFWCSWGLVYAIVIAVVSVLTTFTAWATRLFIYSNMFILFLMLFLYGLSIITMAFLVTPFFNKSQVAGALTSLMTIVFSVLYLAVSLTTKYTPEGPVSSVSTAGQWAMALISPLALALGIGEGLYLDLTDVGMHFNNIHEGQFPVSASLIMLSVDTVLYGVLAIYFDNVIPGEYGSRQSPFFFLLPSYWCPHKRNPVVDDPPAVNPTSDGGMSLADMEPVTGELKDKNVIRIYNIRKSFKQKKEEVNAVNGISLEMYEGQITCLLGHNGAGKTTLINMLTGMTPPTDGFATIYGYDVSQPSEMVEIRKLTGVCPQHNILFDELSCKEHLTFVTGMKGLSAAEADIQIENALTDVQLTDQRDVFAQALSGGQKRKLSLALALVGDPKVIFLDEPTAGMDPFSRRSVWALLKRKRPGRVILLTTHFMDEADILADRKAFISSGKLKCVGSSLFLKNRFGVGYHLGLVIDSGPQQVEEITRMVQSHVSGAHMARNHGKEISYTLPLDAVAMFPNLFKDIEASLEQEVTSTYFGGAVSMEKPEKKNEIVYESSHKSLGIKSYGVSMTTLEEVFFKIDEIEHMDVEEMMEPNGVDNMAFPIEDTPPPASSSGITLEEMQVNSTVPPISSAPHEMDPSMMASSCSLSGSKLTSQKFWALCKVRYLMAIRSKMTILFRVVFPVILMMAGAITVKYFNVDLSETEPSLSLTASLYSYVSGILAASENPNMTYQYTIPAGQNATDFINSISDQGIHQTQVSPSLNLTSIAPHAMGTVVKNVTASGMNVAIAAINIMYNSTAIHSLPSTINVVSNALLLMVTGASGLGNGVEGIVTNSWPWPNISPYNADALYTVFAGSMLLGMAITMIPPGFGVSVVRDKELKIRSQLRISGLSFSLYWGTIFFVDAVQYTLAALLSLIILLALRLPGFMYGGAILTVILVYIEYIPVLMLCVYCLSFGFSKFQNAQSVLPIAFLMIALLPFFLVTMPALYQYPNAIKGLNLFFTIVDPPYAVYAAFYFVGQLYVTQFLIQGPDPVISIGSYFSWDNNILITLIMPCFHVVWLFFLLRYLDVSETRGNPRDVCPCGGDKVSSTTLPEVDNEDIIEEEDPDVKEERYMVDSISQSSQDLHGLPVIVKNLRKEFTKNVSNTTCGSGKSCVKVAVRNSSFVVEPGEMFGLLGPNGAGKTTLLNMIIAEEAPTVGKVLVAGHMVNSSLSEAFNGMGYCGQHDALWEFISLREHIECYAAIRGIPEEKCPGAASYFMNSLQIAEHGDKYSTSLSGGTKRKLSYAISMLGSPKVALMDEPSTGMDPKSKRFMWDTISAAFSGCERGAILTTHYMEEADALCSKVAIMVNGQIMCLGSTQHLKSKYGSGYVLEVKLHGDITPAAVQQDLVHTSNNRSERMDSLKQFVTRLFPQAVELECFEERVIYKIPKDSVGKLSNTFAELEAGKIQNGIEEYAFSQSSLEQVFLEFAKRQSDDSGQTKEMKRFSSMPESPV